MAHNSHTNLLAMPNSTAATAPISTYPNGASLTTILQTDSVACEILRFLLKHESAMDSAKGIAAWWVCRDELAVQPSLQRLFACGAVFAHALSSGSTLYGLTPDADLRACLHRALTDSDEQGTVGDQPPKPKEPSIGAEYP